MNITVVGNDTLAEAAAECCGRYFPVTREPNKDTDLLWVCYDTPVLGNFEPNVPEVIARVVDDLKKLKAGALVLISSQLPVGTTRAFEEEYNQFYFAHSPENLRAKTAVEDFEDQARIIVGVRQHYRDHVELVLSEVLRFFTGRVIYTDPETAEMVKHALNGFLAMSIAYANEIASICKVVGADAIQVTDAMKLDPRVGTKAPIRPGDPYGGGHLEREIWNLNNLAETHKLSLPIISHIQASNEKPHKAHDAQG